MGGGRFILGLKYTLTIQFTDTLYDELTGFDYIKTTYGKTCRETARFHCNKPTLQHIQSQIVSG